MNTKHPYILEKGSKKYPCPRCTKKTFVRYVETETGEHLPEQFGRCDRESKCAHNLSPYNEGFGKMRTDQEMKFTIPKQKYVRTHSKPEQETQPVFFDFETFKQTLEPERYEKNTFIQNLLNRVQFPFEVDAVTKVIELYRLGTIANGYRSGANTFPFIDIQNNVRAIQVKQFDELNSTKSTDFLHSIIEKHHKRKNVPLPEWIEAYKKQEKRVSCLFGEHLLNKYQCNPVALVEAPKTAIYSTLYFGLPETPESLIWLAVYNKSSFSFDKLKVLEGRFVFVFPDLSEDGKTFKEWETKARKYESRLRKTRFIFSDLLEQLAPDQDKSKGNDLADYLIKQDWRLFRKGNNKEQPPQPKPKPEKSEASEASEAPKTKIFSSVPELLGVERNKPERIEQPQNWNKEIEELENHFTQIALPIDRIKLNDCSIISNCSLFLESHFSTVKANNGNNRFLPYLNRLHELKKMLDTNSMKKEHKYNIKTTKMQLGKSNTKNNLL